MTEFDHLRVSPDPGLSYREPVARQFERYRNWRGELVWTTRLVDHETRCRINRGLWLTPKGNREAFLDALDRIYRIPHGGVH